MSSFGEDLKRERELRKITLREVSEATKINLRYLEALERNDFRHLPGGVFNKGFVRAIAQFIGVDADSMVDAYLHELQSQSADLPPDTDPGVLRGDPAGVRTATEPVTEPEPARSAAQEPAPSRSWMPWLLAGVLLLGALGIAAFAWYQRSSGEPAPASASTHEPEPAPSGRDEPAVRTSPPTGDGDGDGAVDGRSADDQTPESAEPDETQRPAPRDEPPRESPAPAPSMTARADPAPPATDGVIRARFVLDRRTTGRLNCDNRRVEALEGLPLGTVIEMNCRRFLVVDAADGGSLRVGVGGKTPATVVSDGTPLVGYRVLPAENPGPDGRADS